MSLYDDWYMVGGAFIEDDILSDDVASLNGGRPWSPLFLMRMNEGRINDFSYAENFTKRLHQMFRSSECCDVALVTHTKLVKAHKLILAASSDYFDRMFSTTCLESSNSVVSFKDNPWVTYTGLSAILDYAYQGSIEITLSNAREILEAARYFLMDDVRRACETFMTDLGVNNDNCVWMFETAKEYSLADVLEAVNMFLRDTELVASNLLFVLKIAIAGDFDDIRKKAIAFVARELQHGLLYAEELLDADANGLLAMVKADRHNMFTNKTLIEFFVKWVGKRPEDRLPVLSDLIGAINLLCFDIETLEDIANMPFIRLDEICKKHISEAKDQVIGISGDIV